MRFVSSEAASVNLGPLSSVHQTFPHPPLMQDFNRTSSALAQSGGKGSPPDAFSSAFVVCLFEAGSQGAQAHLKLASCRGWT